MEALKMYRKAIRMDDNVERTMMNHPTIEPVEDDAEGPEFVPEIQIITNQEEQSKFMELPSEIAIQIFKWAVYFELPMVIELSAVSKQFQSLVKAAPIWKFMSSRAHQERDLSLCLPDFKSDWFSLWRDLPQLRQDGVYISKVSYIRPGYNAESYTQPLHLVTYFRYIRFLKNGRCMLVTSTSPPNEVVPQLSHFKGTIATHWIWTGPDEITMQVF
ncbi:hypothetical protein EDD86DRAFT_217727 [Gorgonomyces haynaldii]|nr:hypothetical protein EDD86DRAFT_217727 [Gorgonomyces haynaldii]